MPSDGDSFLPRILSVFYAVFDVRQGPKILYQVPEGLIAGAAGFSSGNVPSSPLSTGPSNGAGETSSRNSRNSSSLVSPISETRQVSRGLPVHSSQRRSSSSNRFLFNFDDISKYVIANSSLCGRLVTCATTRHRIIGFPNELRGDYERNYFKFNVCFVFERSADLSCYEPIVRKVGRVLTSCEEESAFLSSPQTSPAIHAILEQLYEDLNSYSETSIPINRFNSIELKIFPFYPNPPPVADWMVPLALINLTKRIEPNWDLTMAKVCSFIDGTNHVSRIAHLADCDLDLTRAAISHLLYYQVIMMIDIFQYSNMYTLRKSIQWLADQVHVQKECGPYVTKPDHAIPDWPTLLHLYSRLKLGTIHDWMQSHDVHSIDIRRFTSFGVIKGFLRRVHRWPIIAPESYSSKNPGGLSEVVPKSSTNKDGNEAFPAGETAPSTDSEIGSSMVATNPSIPPRVRRSSAAEKVLEQVQSREGFTPSTSRSSRAHQLDNPRVRRQSLVSAASATPTSTPKIGPPSTSSRARPSPSASGLVGSAHSTLQLRYPPELLPLLDGEHHTDELATRFGVGWPILQQWLSAVASDRLYIVYR